MTIELSNLNFRDLGGLPAGGARRIRKGLLYRCQGPAAFKDVHREELAELGIRLVCDLRSEKERIRHSHDWGGTARLLNFDMPNDFDGAESVGIRIIREQPGIEGARAAMHAIYARWPLALLPHISRVADAIDEGHLPLLVHCSAGKDRTGVLVALLLRFLGVPHEAVVSDYLLSEVFSRNLRAAGVQDRTWMAAWGFVPEDGVAEIIGGVDPAFIVSAIEAVEAQWGSIDAYFAEAGIDADRGEALRALLTEKG